MTPRAFVREFAKAGFRHRGVIGDCYAPREEWDQVFKRLEALFMNHPGFQARYTADQIGMHMRGTGYLLAISRWPLTAIIPEVEKPE